MGRTLSAGDELTVRSGRDDRALTARIGSHSSLAYSCVLNDGRRAERVTEGLAHEQRFEEAPVRGVASPAARTVPDGGAGGVLALQRAAGNAAVSRMLARQQVPAPAPPATSQPPTVNPADYAKMTWEQLLPTAHGDHGARITSVDLHVPGGDTRKWGTGEAPTLNYADAAKIQVDAATGAPPLAGGTSSTPQSTADAAAEAAFAAARDAAVASIVTARANIPSRSATMTRSPNNNAGWDYNPDKDPSAAGYKTWEQKALPTGVNASDWNWQVFKKIQGLEGQTGRLTTFDRTLSVGGGFSTAGGQTQELLGKTLDALPAVKAVAHAAGLIVVATGDMVVVDTDKKWILHGHDADIYIQTQTQLLSLLVDVMQGAVPTAAGGPDETTQRQNWLDVQWKQFTGGTLAGLTGRVRGWPMESAVLAVHAKHAESDNFPYSFWESNPGPDLRAMVTAIHAKSPGSAWAICTGDYKQFLPK